MFINSSFIELSEYIQKKFRKDVRFTFVRPNEVKVTYLQNALLVKIPVNLELTVVMVSNTRTVISYKGGRAVQKIVDGLLEFLLPQLSSVNEGVQKTDDHALIVNLTKISKVAPLVNNVELKSIVFQENGLKVEFTPKV